MSGARIHNFTLVSVAVLVAASRAIRAFPKQPPNDPLYAPASLGGEQRTTLLDLA